MNPISRFVQQSHVEGEWRDWAKGKEAPRDPDRAFLAFFKTFAEANPI